MTNEERIVDLECRIKELEKAANKQIPWINPWGPPHYDGPNPFDPWPESPPFVPDVPANEGTKCPECGVLWKGVMGYSCPRHNCPMGAGPVTC
jgi:hypothetical protein